MKRSRLPALPRERRVLTRDHLECYLANYDVDAVMPQNAPRADLAVRRLVQEIVRLRKW